jgi:hypothetical protein
MHAARFELVLAVPRSVSYQTHTGLNFQTLLFLRNEQANSLPFCLNYTCSSKCHVMSCNGNFHSLACRFKASSLQALFVSWKQQRGTLQSATEAGRQPIDLICGNKMPTRCNRSNVWDSERCHLIHVCHTQNCAQPTVLREKNRIGHQQEPTTLRHRTACSGKV